MTRVKGYEGEKRELGKRRRDERGDGVRGERRGDEDKSGER